MKILQSVVKNVLICGEHSMLEFNILLYIGSQIVWRVLR